MSKPKVAVLCGGWTEERDVSLESGAKALEALGGAGFEADLYDLRRSASKTEGPTVVARDELLGVLRRARVEAVFLAFHGRLGEDGTVQGLLELGGFPYTGSGVLASALAMDKAMAKRIFAWHGIPTPPFRVWRDGEEIEGEPEPPVVTKPVTGGSTIGVTRVMRHEDLEAGLRSARLHDERVLVEAYVPGRELTAAVLDGEPFTPLEIFAPDGFYDYRSKYASGESARHEALREPKGLAHRVQDLAVEAYKVLGCAGLARADFRMDPQGKLWCLEVNTIPGFTPTSLAPDAAKADGLSMGDLVTRMVDSAIRRGNSGVKA